MCIAFSKLSKNTAAQEIDREKAKKDCQLEIYQKILAKQENLCRTKATLAGCFSGGFFSTLLAPSIVGIGVGLGTYVYIKEKCELALLEEAMSKVLDSKLNEGP